MTRSNLSPSVVDLEGPFAHEHVHTRGIRLHAAVAGDPQDPLIVLIHGSFGGWFEYRHVIAPLAARGYHVAAVDLRGYGMSDKPPTDLGQDLRVLTGDISGLIQTLGHSTAVVIGDDTGASVAWALASERPERVRGLVSISGLHPVDLRRSLVTKPWDFLWILLRAALCRLPVGILERTDMASRLYPTHLHSNTLAAWRDAEPEAFAEALRLRIAAANITNSARGIIWNHRLLTAVTSQKWLRAKVTAPVLFLHSPLALWGPALTRTRRRVTGTITPATVPDSKNLPHIENPQGFVDVVGQWLVDEKL